MGKIIVVHSYKGGTGKTLLAINLAANLAKKGKKVCLFDLDFRAPSLATLFKIDKAECWFNDYLNGICEIDKVFIDMSKKINNAGKFFIGFANPGVGAIRDMSAKDRKWEMRALGRLLSLRTSLLKSKKFDYIIFDTSPGLQYSSINAIVSADLVLVTTTFDKSDIDGTNRMLKELYDLFEKKTGIILNKVWLDAVTKTDKDKWENKIKDLYTTPIMEVIPCFCDISRAGGTVLFVQEKPDHPFVQIVDNLVDKLDIN